MNEVIFGSEKRQQERIQTSSRTCRERWGVKNHYIVYFSTTPLASDLTGRIECILKGARQGHRFTLFLHRRHAKLFRKLEWDHLHTSIRLQTLPLCMPERSLRRSCAALKHSNPEIIMIREHDGIPFPGYDTALSFNVLEKAFLQQNGIS